MEKARINIVCATDDNYAPYCGVMLTSLFENNKDRDIFVYILLSKSLSTDSQKKLKKLASKYNQKIEYCNVDSIIFDNYPIQGAGRDHLSIVAYYRLLAEDILPKEVNEVLYLDCDIIVDGPVGCLFDMNWDNYAIGAVSDMCIEWQEFYDRLQYEKALGYFNSGVLFMNLSYWREHQIGRKCIEYLTNNYAILTNNDQDVLNYVLRNCKRDLSVTYNYQIQFKMPYFFNGFNAFLKKNILETSHPKIVHFAAELKPWMVRYYSFPFNDLWHKYKRKSPWRHMMDKLPEERALIALIKRYILWPFGIKLRKPELI